MKKTRLFVFLVIAFIGSILLCAHIFCFSNYKKFYSNTVDVSSNLLNEQSKQAVVTLPQKESNSREKRTGYYPRNLDNISIDDTDTKHRIKVIRCVYVNKIGRTTVFCAIISKDYRPELYLANDKNDSVEKATEIAKRQNAIICINAGIFDMSTSKTIGYTIAANQVINDMPYEKTTATHYLYMTIDGELGIFPVGGTLQDLEALSPRWAVLGFCPICVDGEYVYSASDSDAYHPRTFIGQDYDGNYILGVCSGRMENEAGLSYNNIYNLVKKIGFEPRILYNLDGGGSSAFVYKGDRLNELTQNEERPCANFLIVK